ncbi:MAG TPA: FKBP-type peptidyl-prolyl cis-trans isomerase [Pyrinomonadaceae bacterium]|nr:FKBP-type peptidyl-prolyl cis-trans isomerase [Pyrinomonadaceae bacterium]
MRLKLIGLCIALLLCEMSVEALAQNTDQNNRAKPSTTRSSAARRRRRTRRRAKPKPPAPPKIEQAGITTATGLTYIITQHGTGRRPQQGETVIVNYTGLLGSGMKFDSSLDHGKPFEFPLGAGRVIKGWDEGIAKLHVGDQATLIIPASIGYGARGAGGVIPPNATLIFLVELVGIKEATPPN